MPKRKVYWLDVSEGAYPTRTTYYRCVGIEAFVDKVEKGSRILGVEFSGNTVGLVLGDVHEVQTPT